MHHHLAKMLVDRVRLSLDSNDSDELCDLCDRCWSARKSLAIGERSIGFHVANASTLARVRARLNFLQQATGRADIDILGS